MDARSPLPTPALPTAPGPLPTVGVDGQLPRISSEQLLAGSQEVLIEHRGALYRLRQTSLGKLILTK